jgi:hypothetical protein
MSRLGRRLTSLVAISLSLPGAPGAERLAPELPAAVRAQLSATYPGWRFARLHPALRYELQSDGARRSTEWVTADFDGDRRQDYAVQIIRNGPADSTQLVMAFLARDRGRYVMSIVSAGGEHLGHILTTARRGERVRDFEQDAMGDSTFVLTHDAVVLLINEGAGITCFREAGGWRCVLSAD